MKNREVATTNKQQPAPDLFQDFFTPFLESDLEFVPQVDIEETDSHYVLGFDLPGLSEDDIRIETRGNQLIVSGEREEERMDEKSKRVTERVYGSFRRMFWLPSDADAENMEASYQNGVLNIALPKRQESSAKQVRIGEKKGGALERMRGRRKGGEKKAA